MSLVVLLDLLKDSLFMCRTGSQAVLLRNLNRGRLSLKDGVPHAPRKTPLPMLVCDMRVGWPPRGTSGFEGAKGNAQQPPCRISAVEFVRKVFLYCHEVNGTSDMNEIKEEE